MSPSQVHEDKAPSQTKERKSSACWSIVFSSVAICLFCCLIQCNSSYFPTCILCLGFGMGMGIMRVCQTSSGILPGQIIFHSRAAAASWLSERLIVCRSVTAENQFTSSLHNITSFHFILCYLKNSQFFPTYFYIFCYLFICLFV